MGDEKEQRRFLIRVRTQRGTETRSVPQEQFVLGRDPQADVCIDHPELSRKHARVEIIGGKTHVTDLGSVNGTFLAGKRIPAMQPCPVDSGVEISLGEVVWVSVAAPEKGDASEKREVPEAAIAARDRAQQRYERVLDDLKEQVEKDSLRKHALLQEIQELSERAAALQKACSKAQSIREEAQELASDAEKQALESEQRQQQLDEKSKDLSHQITASEEELVNVLANLDPRKQELSELEQKIQDESHRHETEERRQHALYEAAQAEAHARELQLKVEIGKIEIQRMEAEKSLQELLHRIDGKKNELTAQESDLRKIQASEKDLRDELDRLSRTLLERDQEIEKADAKRDTALARLKEQEEILRNKAELAGKAKAEIDREIEQTREAAQAEIEKEAALKRKKQEQEFIDQGKKLEQELAGTKLKELAKIEALENEAARNDAERRGFILEEIVRAALERFEGRSDPNQPFDTQSFRKAVQTALEGKSVSAASADGVRRTRIFWRKVGISITLPCVIVLAVLYLRVPEALKSQMDRTIASEQKADGLFYDEIKERGTKYSPPQDHEYRGSYSDNVLYLDGYTKMKLDDIVKSEWTLALNDFLVGKLGLSDRVIPDFVSRETVMVRQLSKASDDILPQYKDQGIARLASIESQDLPHLKKLLQNEQNYIKFRSFERNFYESHLKN